MAFSAGIKVAPRAVMARNVSQTKFDLLGTKFMISVQDMKRAIAFYTTVFPLDVSFHSSHWSELKYQSSIIALHGGGSAEFRNTGLSFTVDDIHSACVAVVRGGGLVRSGPEDRGDEGIILAHLTDTEGNGFMISQDKSR